MIKQNQQGMRVFFWLYIFLGLLYLRTTFLLRLESTAPEICNLIDLGNCINPLSSLSTGSGKLVCWNSFSALTVFYNVKLQTQQNKDFEGHKTSQLLFDQYTFQ